jgi:hypothetical protein
VSTTSDPAAATGLEGPYGSAVKLDTSRMANNEETVCSWLITAPSFHPAWSQYALFVVRLRDLPGWPPPVRHFGGATHELIVVTLNPEHGPYDAGIVTKFAAGNLPVLTPVNVAHQIQGTDGEAEQLAYYGTWGICNGHLEPESSNGADRIRAGWDVSLVKTLAHIRNEAHAS